MIVNFIQNPDNSPNLSIISNERTLRLHSSRPLSEAQKMFSQLANSPAYFLGGLGLGYLLEHILTHTEHKLCVIFEPYSTIFEQAVLHRPIIKDLLNDPRVVFVQSTDTLAQCINQHKLKELGFLIHRPYADLFPEQMQEAQEVIMAGIRRSEIGNATLLRFGKLWAKNILRNMPRYFTSQKLCSYKGFGKDKPAIIIGAGPSLSSTLPYLQKLQDKAFYIACDTALPILEHHNIKVDFVITVDPQEKNSLYLRYSNNKDHMLVVDPGIHDSSFEGYSDNQIVMMDSLFPFYPYFKDFWGECGLLASGGSVSTSAYDFARQLQCDPIIMVGQDLSFTSQQLHSNGNVLTQFAYAHYSRLVNYHTRHAHTTHPAHGKMIKGRLPNSTVQADVRFVLFRDWFSQEIPKTNAKTIIVGMNGAFVEGAEHLPVEQGFANIIHNIDKSKLTLLHKKNDHEFLLFIQELYASVNKIHTQSHHILIQIKQHQNNLSKILTETTKLQQILESSSNTTISGIISVAVQSSIQKALDMPETLSEQQQISVIKEFCSEIVESLNLLKNQLHKLIHKQKNQ